MTMTTQIRSLQQDATASTCLRVKHASLRRMLSPRNCNSTVLLSHPHLLPELPSPKEIVTLIGPLMAEVLPAITLP